MKRKNTRMLSAILTLSFALTVIPTSVTASDTTTFQDVPQSHWAYNAVEKMANQGIVQGKSDGIYDPAGTVTYAQWAKMVVNLVHPDQCFHCTQVLSDDWWGGYVGAALDANLSINGRHLFADTMVHQVYMLNSDATWLSQTMDSGISRYDMARVLYNMATMLGLEDGGKDVSGDIADWDAMAGSHMADAVAFCYGNALLQGDSQGNFNGTQTVTRAQAAAVLNSMLEALETQANQPKKEETKVEETKTEEKSEESSSSKDDSSSSDKDSGSSDKDDSSSSDKDSGTSTDSALLNKVLQAMLDYFDGLNSAPDDNVDDGVDPDGADDEDCNCKDDNCESDCDDQCACGDQCTCDTDDDCNCKDDNCESDCDDQCACGDQCACEADDDCTCEGDDCDDQCACEDQCNCEAGVDDIKDWVYVYAPNSAYDADAHTPN